MAALFQQKVSLLNLPRYFIDNQDSEVATRSEVVDGLKPDIIRASTNCYMKAITMLKYLKWPKRFLNKKLLSLMLK